MDCFQEGQHLKAFNCMQVAKLQSERELLKRAYGEEKKKADRCVTALNNGQS